MSGYSLSFREAEIFKILEVMYPQNDRFALIGGYAVDAYSPLPRYSVDCDVVISKASLNVFTALYAENGFQSLKQRKNDPTFAQVLQFQKFDSSKRIEIDLLVESVKCRQTNAIWSSEEIQKASEERLVTGVNGSVQSRVSSREQLIAMKLHSGRDADLRDVVMLMDDVNWKAAEMFTIRGAKEKTVSQLKSALTKINSENFKQQLGASFGPRAKNEKTRIAVANAGINRILLTMRTN